MVLWTGTVLGALIGVVHAFHIYRSQSQIAGADSRAMALYRGFWAIVLWTLFGGYLLVMWVIGAIARPIYQLATKSK